jgi:tetratricopeptide (TPR) repeat protein
MGPRPPALRRGLELLQAAVRADPQDRESCFWLASALVALHRGDEAVPLLEQLLAASPQWHTARFRLAVAYDQQRQYQQAIEHYERIVADAPQWLEPYPLLVRLHLFRGAGARSEALCRQQLSLFPDADCYANLALARQLQGAPAAEVLSWIDRALGLDPRHIPAHLNRGYLRLAQGAKAAAQQDFERILAQDPEHPKARAGLAAAQ